MKTLLAAALFAVASVASFGCAPLDQSVFVESASFLDQSCAATGDTKLARGSLDLGPAAAFGTVPKYFALFGLTSELEPIVVQSGDDVLSGSTKNEFVASSVILSYQLQSGAGVASATEPIYFVVEPQSTNGSIQFNLLNQAAAQAIAGAVPAGGTDLVVVTFQFEGNVRSAANGLIPMHTPAVNFPIRLFNTPTTVPTCTTGSPIIKGPCGNSQESYTLGCSS